MPDWPFPEDSSVERARRVAIAYRTVLLEVAPERCAMLDAQMRLFNQTWIVGHQNPRDDDELVSGREAAELLSVTPGAVRQYRLRGYLCGLRTTEGYYYRVGDIRAFRPLPPGRKPATPLAQ